MHYAHVEMITRRLDKIIKLLGASQPPTLNTQEEGPTAAPCPKPGEGIDDRAQASVQGAPAPGPHKCPWKTVSYHLGEENERLRDELFWTRRRAEQAEQDAARFLEQLEERDDVLDRIGGLTGVHTLREGPR